MSQRAVGAISRSAILRSWVAQNVGSTQRRCIASGTTPLLEKRVVKVPTMGDSITEGTIVEWSVSVGQSVKADDVVALVETDKVTIDIKADVDGVITQQFGNVDDTIEVGASMYEIDTEAEATVEASSQEPAAASKGAEPPAEKEASPPPEKAASKPSESKDASTTHRTPSIKFLGKEGWAARLKPAPSAPKVVYIPPAYGRLPFSDDEMEALITGGANVAPDVKQFSGGASFSY